MYFGGIPFGDDFREMGGHSARRPKGQIDNKFYDLLELDRSASAADIKKAYRKLAVRHHPDKGGDPEMFKSISKAYEVLSDSEKKKIYDEYGEEGLEDTGGGADAEDIFSMFFGGGRKAANRKKKGEDIVSMLSVTLEQIYCGATRKMAIHKNVLCEKCNGSGGNENGWKTCMSCDGRGMVVLIQTRGNLIQQTQRACEACGGKGKTISEGDKCKSCRATCVVKTKKVLEVYVEKGASNSSRVTFSGEADEKPGEIPGDVIFVIQQKEHQVFTRKGDDLYVKKEITLLEALTGFKFILTHLDNRKLLVQSNEHEIITPGCTKYIKNEGMPVAENPILNGHLIVLFDIVFPLFSQLPDKAEDKLAALLPKPKPLKENLNNPELEIHYIQDISEEELNQRANASKRVQEDEEQSDMQGERVKCRNQ